MAEVAAFSPFIGIWIFVPSVMVAAKLICAVSASPVRPPAASIAFHVEDPWLVHRPIDIHYDPRGLWLPFLLILLGCCIAFALFGLYRLLNCECRPRKEPNGPKAYQYSTDHNQDQNRRAAPFETELVQQR